MELIRGEGTEEGKICFDCENIKVFLDMKKSS